MSIHFYDASDASDVEDITEEVIEEADEHFVYYQVSSASLSISAASNDVQDAAGISINLKTEWAAAGASSGTVRVYLIHEPTSKLEQLVVNLEVQQMLNWISQLPFSNNEYRRFL